MPLLDMIKSATAKEVENYLRGLTKESPDQLFKELSQCNSKKMTPLHLAVQRGDLELVKTLLSFDASIEAKIDEETVENYAKGLAESKSDKTSEQSRKIYALLKSRGRWQIQAIKNQEISLSRSMKAIEEAMEKIRGAEGKIGALLLGITGQGKSTLVNFLCGVDYEIKRDDGGARKAVPKSGSSEIARVGDTTTSETLFPQIVPDISDVSCRLIDLPGFQDTRGSAEEICAATSINMLTKQLQGIQALLFVCSWGAIEDTRMTAYRAAAEIVGAMISLNAQTGKNVILIVTKPPSDIEERHIRHRLTALCKDEHWEDEKIDDKEIKRKDFTPEEWKKQCIKRATKAIVAGKDNIFLADVSQPALRKKFGVLVNNLSSQVQKPKEFDFTDYSPHMTKFQLAMEFIIINYNKLARDRHLQEEKIRKLKEDTLKFETEQKELTDQIDKFDKQKTEPFTPETFDKMIAEQTKELKELEQKNEKYIKTMNAAELEFRVAESMQVEQEGEKLIDTIHRGWVCEKTPDITHKDVEEIGKPVWIPDMGDGRGGWGTPVRVVEKTTPGIEKTVSEPIRYPSTVPIKRFSDRSHGGKFTAGSFSSGAMELSGTFASDPGARGGVSLSIELYGHLKDFPETKEKINRLEQNKKKAENHLEEAKRNAVSSGDVAKVRDALMEIEINKIEAKGDHERTKAICDMQINAVKPLLDKVTKELKKLQQELPTEQYELDDLSLQIDVNKELFDKLYQIIMTMGFRNDTFDQFIELYSKSPSTGAKKSTQPSSSSSSSSSSSASDYRAPSSSSTSSSTRSLVSSTQMSGGGGLYQQPKSEPPLSGSSKTKAKCKKKTKLKEASSTSSMGMRG